MRAATPLVRRGGDAWLPPAIDKETGARTETHTVDVVLREMLLQICREYPGLPDPRTLTATEIRFFYEGLRSELHALTKPKK